MRGGEACFRAALCGQDALEDKAWPLLEYGEDLNVPVSKAPEKGQLRLVFRAGLEVE